MGKNPFGHTESGEDKLAAAAAIGVVIGVAVFAIGMTLLIKFALDQEYGYVLAGIRSGSATEEEAAAFSSKLLRFRIGRVFFFIGLAIIFEGLVLIYCPLLQSHYVALAEGV